MTISDPVHVTAAKAVHEVARKWVLTRGANGFLAFLAEWETRGGEVPLHAVVVAQHAATCGRQVARPAHVTVGMAQVQPTTGMEQAEQTSALAFAVSPRDAQLEDVADTTAPPD